MSNVMATIERIVCTYPIEGADAIEMAQVLDFHVVVKKGEFSQGDRVVYARVDSIFPDGLHPDDHAKYVQLKKDLSKVTSEDERIAIQSKIDLTLAMNTKPQFEFLRGVKFKIKAKKYNKFADKFGNPIISQGIIFGMFILPTGFNPNSLEGVDVTDILEIGKVVEDLDEVVSDDEKDDSHPALKFLDRKFMRYSWYRKLKTEIIGKKVKGTWADWMPPKSDEENIQKLFTSLKNRYGTKAGWVVTEKMEGQSVSFYLLTSKKFFGLKKDEHFGVCSRNIHMPVNNGSPFWSTALQLDVYSKLKAVGKNIFVRGERCGPGVQGNIYEFPAIRVFIYDVWDIDARRKYSYPEMVEFCETYGFETCPVIEEDYAFPDTVQEALAYSNGKSEMGPVWREGVVVRRFDDSSESVKFKSPEYEIRKGDKLSSKALAYPGK